MVKREVIQSHVESLLQRLLETDQVKQAPDGEWPVRYGTALYNVRVKDGGTPHVEAYAVAVEGVRDTKPLLEAINDINLSASHTRTFFLDGRVIVAGEVVGETLDFEELTCLCNEVGAAADGIGQSLKARFGGRTAFEDSGEEPAETAAGQTDGSDGTGGYL